MATLERALLERLLGPAGRAREAARRAGLDPSRPFICEYNRDGSVKRVTPRPRTRQERFRTYDRLSRDRGRLERYQALRRRYGLE